MTSDLSPCWSKARPCHVAEGPASGEVCEAWYRCQRRGNYIIRWWCQEEGASSTNSGPALVACTGQSRNEDVSGCPPPIVCPEDVYSNQMGEQADTDSSTDILLVAVLGLFALLSLTLIAVSSYKYWAKKRSHSSVPLRKETRYGRGIPYVMRCHSPWGADVYNYNVDWRVDNTPRSYDDTVQDVYIAKSSPDHVYMPHYALPQDSLSSMEAEPERHPMFPGPSSSWLEPSVITGSFVFHQPSHTAGTTALMQGWSFDSDKSGWDVVSSYRGHNMTEGVFHEGNSVAKHPGRLGRGGHGHPTELSPMEELYLNPVGASMAHINYHRRHHHHHFHHHHSHNKRQNHKGYRRRVPADDESRDFARTSQICASVSSIPIPAFNVHDPHYLSHKHTNELTYNPLSPNLRYQEESYLSRPKNHAQDKGKGQSNRVSSKALGIWGVCRNGAAEREDFEVFHRSSTSICSTSSSSSSSSNWARKDKRRSLLCGVDVASANKVVSESSKSSRNNGINPFHGVDVISTNVIGRNTRDYLNNDEDKCNYKHAESQPDVVSGHQVPDRHWETQDGNWCFETTLQNCSHRHINNTNNISNINNSTKMPFNNSTRIFNNHQDTVSHEKGAGLSYDSFKRAHLRDLSPRGIVSSSTLDASSRQKSRCNFIPLNLRY